MAGTSYTYTAVGNLEDWSDVLTNITPDKTPAFSMFKKGKTVAMEYNWLTDSLRAPAENAHMEDADLLAVAAPARVRLSNYTQIFQVGYFVTDSQEVVDKAAVKSEIGLQMKKALKELARDVEERIIKGADMQLSSATLPGKMAGINYFNDVNIVDASDTTLYADAKLSEDMLNDAVQKAWERGGEPDLVYLSGANKRIVSGFTANAVKHKPQGEKKLVNVIDVYESDFGVVEIMAHRHYTPDYNRVDIIQRDMWSTMYLIPFQQESLPRTRFTTDKNINGSLTIKCNTKEAHACIINLD